jgi:hypothetical protein
MHSSSFAPFPYIFSLNANIIIQGYIRNFEVRTNEDGWGGVRRGEVE